METLYPRIAPGIEKFPKIKYGKTEISEKVKGKLQNEQLMVSTYNDPEFEAITTNLVHQLESNLGQKVGITVDSHKIAVDKFLRGDFKVMMMGLGVFLDIPSLAMSVVKTKYTGWDDEPMQKLIRQAEAQKDIEHQTKYYLEAEKVFQEKLPAIPLLHRANLVQVGDRVENFNFGHVKMFLFRDVKLK